MFQLPPVVCEGNANKNKCACSITVLTLKVTVCISGFYLLLAALSVLLSVLGFSQQVGEGQRFEGARAGGSGIPERVGVPRIPPAADRAERARPHAAWRVDTVDADHRGEFRVQKRSIWLESISGLREFDWTLESLWLKKKKSDPVKEKNFQMKKESLNGQRWPNLPKEKELKKVSDPHRSGFQRRGRPLGDLQTTDESQVSDQQPNSMFTWTVESSFL